MEVRHLCGVDDVQEVYRVNVLAWREAYDDILPDAVLNDRSLDIADAVVEDLFAELRDDRNRFLVAVDASDTVRGYIYLRWGEDAKEFVDKNEADLQEIYADPNCWGDGVGTTLLKNGLDVVPDRIEAMKLEMLSGNAVGERFYEVRGFTPIATSEVKIGDETYPTIIYELRL
jgi:GNAT superfamily N-acetyltransferase